jgi:hypothetical protein
MSFWEHVGNAATSVGEAMKSGFDWLANDSADWFTNQGGYNWLFAAPGAVLGFMLSHNLIASSLGGGFFANIAAFPLSLVAAMAGAFLTTRAVNGTYDWFQGQINPEVARSPQPPASAPAPQPSVEPDQLAAEVLEAGLTSRNIPLTDASVTDITLTAHFAASGQEPPAHMRG